MRADGRVVRGLSFPRLQVPFSILFPLTWKNVSAERKQEDKESQLNNRTHCFGDGLSEASEVLIRVPLVAEDSEEVPVVACALGLELVAAVAKWAASCSSILDMLNRTSVAD